jgi:hypothetical protein
LSFWSVLGIEATRDATAIKRAYAARLKDCHPEDDPDGFQRLRAAYEGALRYATPRKPRRATPLIDPKARRKQPPIPDEAVALLRDLIGQDPPVVVDPDPTVAAADEAPAPVKREAKPPKPQAAPDPVTALRIQHDRRCRALQQLVLKGADADALRAALDELLASEPMESVGIHGRTELWLADLIADNSPRSDPLAAPAIQYFGWRANRLGRERDSSMRVLARADDIVFLEGLRRKQGDHFDAWKALNAKPTRARRWTNIFVAGGVRRLLHLIRMERPSLMGDIDSEGLAWWGEYLSHPQIPAEVAVIGFVCALVGTPILASSPWFGSTAMPWLYAAVACFGGLALALWGGLYGVARVRERWMRKRFSASAWQRLGWAPSAMVLVLASAVAPPFFWTTPLFPIAGLWLVYWVAITGEPDRRDDVGHAWRLARFWNPIWMIASILVNLLMRPGLRFPWPVRALFNFVYLALFGLVLLAVLPTPLWLQMAGPVAAGMAVFTWGAGSLHEAWRDEAGETQQRLLKGALAGLVVLGAALLAFVDQGALWAALAAALVTVAVYLQKVMDIDLGPKAWMGRDAAMRYGWFGWLIFAIAVLGPNAPRQAAELRFGLWLLTGPAIVAAALILGPLAARRVKPKPA